MPGRGLPPLVPVVQLPFITMTRGWTGVNKGNLQVVVLHAARQPLPNHMRACHLSADLCALTTCQRIADEWVCGVVGTLGVADSCACRQHRRLAIARRSPSAVVRRDHLFIIYTCVVM